MSGNVAGVADIEKFAFVVAGEKRVKCWPVRAAPPVTRSKPVPRRNLQFRSEDSQDFPPVQVVLVSLFRCDVVEIARRNFRCSAYRCRV